MRMCMHAGTLLDVWTKLLNQLSEGHQPAGVQARARGPSAAVAAAIEQCAGVIFGELLQAHLRDCDAGAAAEAQDDAAEARPPSAVQLGTLR